MEKVNIKDMNMTKLEFEIQPGNMLKTNLSFIYIDNFDQKVNLNYLNLR